MKLVSMKIEKKDEEKEYKDKSMLCCEPEDGGPAYPYGLTICLNDDSLKKLGIDKMPTVGSQMMLYAMVTVTGNSQRQNQEDTDSNMDLQITDMSIGPAPDKTAAQGLYSASDMNP